ncbi:MULTISPECIES: SMI1/KNR4 family protein [Vibrio]|uniref:SMI1/KNR4 family protein n=1 Tax=Vibrio TaxID=662 RepID=UPI000DE2E1D4|nr:MULTISPECIES: SMI1/KNR4 family protein [Vibrio]MCG6350834.1 SMI1/KNR4 family protein [Vibrio fluvialis]QEO46459.1 SMI1/KNR4 family protein [Vibrio cholerae]RBM31825.1 SMI1/KNR4 family protein [Vibrio tarriae]RBM35795.1 SMI1/KNR4 family protein [Vibrio tarriae]
MKKIAILYDGGAVDKKIIEDFERKLGVSFPHLYKELLSQHNEIYLEESFFEFKNVDDTNDSRDVTFWGYGDQIDKSSRVELNQDHDVYGHDLVVAIGCAANGDYICFDYRDIPETDNPSVVVMFHDDYDENNKMIVCHVADSFEQFIDMLYKYDD